MTIADPWNLDPTSPISNSSFNSVNVAEGMAPSLVNNAMRQLASFFAQTTSYKSADLSTSVSTNIAATGTGLYMDLTGANAVNSFGSPAGAEQPNAAVFRFLQYDSSASVSHGANIQLIGSTSRKMQPGDVQGVIHEGSGVWREFCFARASGNLPMDSLSVTTITNRSMSTSAISTVTLNAASISVTNQVFTTLNATSVSASVIATGILQILDAGGTARLTQNYVQTVTASTAASASTSSNIPFDTSIPQNNEGANLFSLTITPRNTNSIIEIEALLCVSHGSTAIDLIAAVYLDNAADAIAATSQESIGGDITQIKLYHEHTASTASAHVYALRYGAESGALKVNHGAGGNLGGVMRSWLRIRERLS